MRTAVWFAFVVGAFGAGMFTMAWICSGSHQELIDENNQLAGEVERLRGAVDHLTEGH